MAKTNSGPTKLLDVALRAQCSAATVSRVLNGNRTVAPDIRDRVLRAAADLAYVPNGSAKSLRSTKSRLAGAIIPTLDHAIYAAMIESLQARLSERDISLILSTSLYDIDVELEQIRLFVERGAEAVVLVGAIHRAEAIKLLERHNIPYVFTHTNQHGPKGAAVGFDNYQAGVIAAKFLFDLGHRRLGMLAGITDNNDRATARVKGFTETLAGLGVARAAISVIELPYRIEEGRAGMQTLFETVPHVTAVFCGSDILAAGALKYCNAAGIAVPGDVSVLGFDNHELAGLTTPELSTLEVPAKEMGRLAADFIVAEPGQRIHLRQPQPEVRLVIRGSTGPSRAATTASDAEPAPPLAKR